MGRNFLNRRYPEFCHRAFICYGINIFEERSLRDDSDALGDDDVCGR